MAIEDLAEGVIRIAVAKMTGAIREISVSRGLDPRHFTLVAYGGAGPMHGALVAEELGMTRVLVPRLPGNFSALGLLTADLRWDATRSLFARLDAAGIDDIGQAVAALKQDVVGHLARDGVAAGALSFEIFVQMNYIGQASSFSVRTDEQGIETEALHRAFLAQYEDRYGHANPGRQIAISGVRVVAIAASRRPNFDSYRQATSPGGSAGSRAVVFQGRAWTCPVLTRDALVPNETRDGPAIIEESGATTVVPPGWNFRLDDLLNIHLTRRETTDLQSSSIRSA
jgi:N-methylhydantoinase A